MISKTQTVEQSLRMEACKPWDLFCYFYTGNIPGIVSILGDDQRIVQKEPSVVSGGGYSRCLKSKFCVAISWEDFIYFFLEYDDEDGEFTLVFFFI